MNTESNRPKREDTREIVDSLVDLGAVWARYGLRVAEASLKASSHTLDTTARALGNLAEAFNKDDGTIVTHAEESPEPKAERA